MPHRPLPRHVGERARLVPPDQQADRQPTAAAARRRGHARGRGSRDKGRGYEIGEGQYLQVEDDEIDAIQVESTHTIEIEKFVPLSEIDVRYFDSPYYLIPEDKVGLDAFAVIRDAMASKKMVASAAWCCRSASGRSA